MSLDSYGLKGNPFSVVPAKAGPIWADRRKFKKELEDSLKFTLQGSQSQIIACIWGDWGCGKTHAMTYFSNPYVLQKMAGEMGVPKDRILLSIPSIFPTEDVFHSLYLDIVYRNLIPKLKDVVIFLSKKTTPLESDSSLEDKLLELAIDGDLARVLSKFTDRRRSVAVRRYLSRNASRTDLNDLGVAKGIETTNEMLLVLTDMLKIFAKTIYWRIFIWIDDCERIEEVTGKSMFEFQHFLRDVLDLMPERLTLVTNFTKLPGGDISERIKYLGPAVQNRITKIITVDYFTLDDYLEYVKEMLGYYRKTKARPTQTYSPFSEECLRSLFKMLMTSPSNLQPRTVNRVLSALLERGLRDGVPFIDENYLMKTKEEVQDVMAS